MTVMETSVETKVKILLDEANLAFSETSGRKDKAGERTLDGSAWDAGKMEGEYDTSDFNNILELQLKAAKICDAQPQAEERTQSLFQSVTAGNAESVLREVAADASIMELARIAVTVFLLRYPTVQAFVGKGHPLVLAMDEYMLSNAGAQNWYDYHNVAREFGWI